MDDFDAYTYKFSEVKYRGDFIPKGRQGHQAVPIDQYNMYVIGGTYSNHFIDQLQVPNEEMVLNFDMDSGSWARVKVKENEATPWNLVYHSAFKLDKGNIGVLWYDYNLNGEEIVR